VARVAYTKDDMPIETVINVFPGQQWRLSNPPPPWLRTNGDPRPARHRVKEVAMILRVRLWITAIVIMASAALTAAATTAAHAGEERSQGTGHSGQAAYAHVHLADAVAGAEFNQVAGGPVFSRLAG
jgi:hypothetical protein